MKRVYIYMYILYAYKDERWHKGYPTKVRLTMGQFRPLNLFIIFFIIFQDHDQRSCEWVVISGVRSIQNEYS